MIDTEAIETRLAAAKPCPDCNGYGAIEVMSTGPDLDVSLVDCGLCHRTGIDVRDEAIVHALEDLRALLDENAKLTRERDAARDWQTRLSRRLVQRYGETVMLRNAMEEAKRDLLWTFDHLTMMQQRSDFGAQVICARAKVIDALDGKP